MYFQYGPSSISEVKFAENNKSELYSTQLHPLRIPKHLKSLWKVLFLREKSFLKESFHLLVKDFQNQNDKGSCSGKGALWAILY